MAHLVNQIQSWSGVSIAPKRNTNYLNKEKMKNSIETKKKGIKYPEINHPATRDREAVGPHDRTRREAWKTLTFNPIWDPRLCPQQQPLIKFKTRDDVTRRGVISTAATKAHNLICDRSPTSERTCRALRLDMSSLALQISHASWWLAEVYNGFLGGSVECPLLNEL